MYKKIMFILLTLLFMSGSCDLDGDKPNAISKKAQTASKTNTPIPTDKPSIGTKPIDTTPISLVDTHKDSVKFADLKLRLHTKGQVGVHYVDVESVLISTTDAALKAANITSLSEAKSMRDQAKLNKLIKSLTFTIRGVDRFIKALESISRSESTIKGDYENLKIIYEGLSNDKDDSNLKPMLNISGKDVEFDKGFFKEKKRSYFLHSDSSGDYTMMFDSKECSKMISFLGDILCINGIEKFKKYLP